MPATTRSTVLVTGSEGQTASALVDLLSLSPNQFDTRTVSLSKSDVSSLEDIFSTTRIDSIFLVPPQTRDAIARVRILLDVAQQHNVAYVVLVSMLGAEDQTGTFAEHFTEMEHHLQSSRLPHTILRTSPLQQNFLHLADDFHQPIPTIALPISNGSFAPVHAKDVARAAVALLSNPSRHLNRTYTLTGPDLLTGVEIAGRASMAIDRPVRFRNGSIAQARAQMRRIREEHETGRLQEWFIQSVVQVYQAIAAGHYQMVTSDVLALTGRPATPIDIFFQENKSVFNKSEGSVNDHHDTRPAACIMDRSADYVSVAYKGAYGTGLGRYVLLPLPAKL
ncbi:uncharacterized protein SPPG_06465 [Spizellomyces punctatus DAOM BR117]|uniref:NmrA-like domain-containing protein n=1 Tax=Spizellomyces punctatus (strain DAOM BR117) TaxID=645134 RepID=A0A0L0HAR0_SPIPD|nr:uncharacterized protein SPPG_06465 [Spizellomyces punctatus DAOM BR117]KNC98051.1 hypothetical protein SPPG_06465 [Spizellomyces punctatus DAOM BR117]|eukprot:XP_016606091.1 hypothetical protein SPPG_06465 [Spizellomyces punctatus DAOM BR117]